jgi:outer membrane lipoprotein-sorting protein
MRVVAFLLLLSSLRAAAATPSAAEIVRKHLDAIGGARWQRVDSLLITGSGAFGTVTWAWKKPDRIRTEEREPAGRTLVTAFDGKSAWISNPFQDPKPRAMTPEETRQWRAGLAIRSDLLDLPKDATVEVVGNENVDGRPAWKLSLRRDSADEVFLWIDAKTFLLVQRARTMNAPWGGSRTPVTPLRDYRNVEGLMIPHAVGATKLTVEVNPQLDDDTFRLPVR